MAKSNRVVSMVCAAARKCHARCPKKLRCSTTDVSIFAAFTEYFESKTRYSRVSPARNGTGATAGAATVGVLERVLGRLDFCARAVEAHTSMAPSIAAPQMHRVLFIYVRNTRSCRGVKAGTPLSLRACKSGENDIAHVARYS